MTTINITNSGSGAYLINDVSNGDISLVRGNTYNLVINATGHPFWIRTIQGAYSDNGYGNNYAYTSGITNNGTQNGTITFVVPNDAPNTLYYVCQNHSSMQGRILITSTATLINPTLSGFSIPTKTVGDSSFTITAPTSNSTGAFSYTSSNTSIASISGSTVTILQAGTVTVTTTQAATSTYNSGSISTSLQVNTATVCLTNPSIVNIVASNGNKYVFNNSSTYNSNIVYGLGIGTYVLKNVPEGHPMALLNNGVTNTISYSGDSSKKFTKQFEGVVYDFYYGDITVKVNGNFGTISVNCYYHGYMGGQNLFKYSASCFIGERPISMRSFYTNNAQVFYKPNSLAPCGTGSVRNSRLKSRKT